MPSGSQASYEGSAWIVIDPLANRIDDNVTMIGDASLVADFGNGTITGDVTNLTAAIDLTDTTYAVAPVTGGIGIGQNFSAIGTDTQFNLIELPNQWTADYVGDVVVDGNSYVFAGYVVGNFRGTRVNGPAGLAPMHGMVGFDEFGLASVNGSQDFVAVYFEVFAEN